MRYVNTVLCLLMLLFAGVQHNDPDGPLWMLVYAVPALWAGLAAFRPRLVARPVPQSLLLGCVALAALGIVHYWPDTPRWWASDVWWEVETAREGMGMMIVALVLLVVWASVRVGPAREASGVAPVRRDDGRPVGERPSA